MKPTPSKLVLLMSAAGLGLSYSGVAVASRDSGAPASVALTFGVAPSREPGCNSQSHDAWASCPTSDRELLRTMIVDSAAVPPPLAPLPLPLQGSAQLLFRDFHADVGTSESPGPEGWSGDGDPQPSGEAPLPEALAAPRNIETPIRDPVADAIAFIALDDADAVLGVDGTTASGLTGPTAPAVQRAPSIVALRVSEVEERGAVGGADASNDAADVRDRSGSIQTGRKDEAPADAGPWLAAVSGSAEDDHSVDGTHVGTSAEPTGADSPDIDRIFASLAEVLGSQLEESATGFEQPREFAAQSKKALAVSASATEGTGPAQVAPAPSPAHAANGGGRSAKRSSEADGIVVVSSHSDKLLMSLAALRSGEDPQVVGVGAANNVVVVGHTDKVLATLAMFRSKKAGRGAFSCLATSGEEPQAVMPSRPSGHWANPERASEPTFAAIGAAPDAPPDLLPPVADKAERPVLHAVLDVAAPPDKPMAVAAVRSAIGSDVVALSADKLDEVRGGFVTDGGLKISFGIERAVYLNGTLVTTTSLNIADLAKISGGQAQVTGTGNDVLALLQSGTGNVFSPGSISSTAAGTVIQNTLDNQKISTITRVDAVVSSSSIMRSINLQSSMQSAIVNSLRR